MSKFFGPLAVLFAVSSSAVLAFDQDPQQRQRTTHAVAVVFPTDGSKEDVVPMAMGAAWKLRRVIGNVRNVLAIELLCACQGIDFRRPLRSSAPVEQAHALVRKLVPSMDRDRAVSPDILHVADAIREGTFDDV